MQQLLQVTFHTRKVARRRADDMVLPSNVIVRPCWSLSSCCRNRHRSGNQAAHFTQVSEALSKLDQEKDYYFSREKAVLPSQRNRSFSTAPSALSG